MLKLGFLRQILRGGAAIATLFALGSAMSSAQSLTVIRAAAIADDDAATILYAERSGAFRRAGLDIQFQGLSGGSAIAAAVIGGGVDVGKSGTVTLVNAHDRNVPFTIVAPGSIYDAKDSLSELVVAVDSPVHSAKDLNGRTVAVGSLKGLEQICISGWVDNNGGDSKTLHFLDMPLTAMRAALETHRVETAMMTDPALAEELASGKVRILGHATDGIALHFLGTAWFASTDWARAHSAAVAAFSRVMRETSIYVNAHPADTVPIIADLTGISADRIANMPRNAGGSVLNASDLQPVINAAAKYGTISKVFPAAELIFAAR
jgi:NitT/TauT family transport system substrate-binding protein